MEKHSALYQLMGVRMNGIANSNGEYHAMKIERMRLKNKAEQPKAVPPSVYLRDAIYKL